MNFWNVEINNKHTHTRSETFNIQETESFLFYE